MDNIPQFIVGKQITQPNVAEQIFEAHYSAQDPIITEHRIYNIAVVPGSLHLARLAYVVCNIYHKETFTITEITFIKPLALKEDETRLVQLIITQETAQQYSFKFVSFDAQHGAENKSQLHAVGHFVIEEQVAYTSSDKTAVLAQIKEITARCKQQLSIERFDRYFAVHELKYATAYKWIEQIHYGVGESINVMRASSTTAEKQWNVLQPGQIDCSFQGLISIIFDKAEQDPAKEAWVLGGINRIKFFAKPQGKIICHNILLDYQNFTGDTRKAISNINFYDDLGNLIAQFEGVLVAKVTKDKILGLMSAN